MTEKSDIMLTVTKMEAQQRFLGITEITIPDDEHYQIGTSLLQQAKGYHRRLDDERKKLVGPLNEQVKAINDMFRPFTDRLSVFESKMKMAMGEYLRKKENDRRKALKDAEEAAARVSVLSQPSQDTSVQEALVRASEAQAPQVSGVSQRSVIRFELVDLSQVPRDYLCLDEARVREAIKAGVRDIPGLRIYEDKTLAIRAV